MSTIKPFQIDLTGPGGNAFALMATAKKLAQKLGKDPKPIIDRMTAGDYDALIDVFDQEFGDFVTLHH